MKLTDFDDLDTIIDAALRDEPLRPAPFGFGRALEKRLAVQRRIDAERRRLVRTALIGCVGLMVSVLALVAAGAQWGSAILEATPGLRGYLDGVTAPYAAWGATMAGAALLGGVIATLLAGAILLRPAHRRPLIA